MHLWNGSNLWRLDSRNLKFVMINDNSAAIVSKVWNYAHVLKNAGVGYGDYVEQITYLLFLKLADEMTELGFDNPDHPSRTSIA